MKESFVGVVILAVIFLLGYLVLAFAQEGTDKKNADLLAKKSADGTPNASRFLHTRPDLHYAADVRFSLPTGQERVLYVVPQNKGSDLHVNGLFFITPAFALEEGEKRNDGYPDVVQAAEKQPDGSTELRFKAILNSDQLNQQARDALLHQPQARALWTKEGLKEVDIQVKPYSVVHAIIALVDLWHEDNFIAVTQSEIRGGSSTEFGFRLTQQELANVNSLANKGRLGFVYSWSFVGKGQDYGEIDLEAIRNLKVSLKSKLTSEQLDGKAPIFQAEANEAARHVALLIRRTGRSNNPNILAIVNTPSLMQHLFVEDKDGITLENLKNTDPEKAKQIAAYLTPQIETLREAIKTEEATRKTNEKTDFIVTKTDDSVSFGIGVILKGIGINFGFGSSSCFAPVETGICLRES